MRCLANWFTAHIKYVNWAPLKTESQREKTHQVFQKTKRAWRKPGPYAMKGFKSGSQHLKLHLESLLGASSTQIAAVFYGHIVTCPKWHVVPHSGLPLFCLLVMLGFFSL